MKILSGKKIAEDTLRKIKREIAKNKVQPGLAVVLIGKNLASEIYVRLKKEKSQEVGIEFLLFRFGEKSKEDSIIEKIKELNKSEKIDGIIVQLPLPKKFNKEKIIDSISPQKDVDGFSAKERKLEPVFPRAILELVKSSGKNLAGKKGLVIANSHTFGKEMALILKKEKIKSEYIISHKIKDNLDKIRKSEILVTAIGKPGIIKGGMIKDGAIIIDGGISKKGKKVLGDVDFESVKNKSGYLSPVPGGVGPVTIACLLRNVFLATKFKN